MFKKGEYVVCGNKGVCTVEDITTLDISGIDSKRQYYILKPVYMEGSTVYIPADTGSETMRRILNHREADVLVEAIPSIPLISGENEKLLEQEYRSCLKANCCEGWIRIIKTVHLRKEERMEAGRKVTAVDAKYCRIAEDNLYGELAVSLGMERKDVEAFIGKEINQDAVTGRG